MIDCEAFAAMEPPPCDFLPAVDPAIWPRAAERVARALAGDEPQARRFLQLLRGGFLPRGRIAEVGATVGTLPGGFVQPVEDSLTGRSQGLPGIMEALAQTVETLRHGADVTCDFSRLRPAGARVKGSQATAPGPLAWMRLFDRACETVAAEGRRPVHTGVLRVDHPDIERFVEGPHGIVALTDTFMRAAVDDDAFHLVHAAEPGFPAHVRTGGDGVPRHVYRTVRARALWNRILGNAYCTGQPAILFPDTLDRGNNLWYCETLQAASADTAQALPAYASSCAGAHDLTRFVLQPSTPRASFDHQAFEDAISTAVEFLDRVLDVTAWPLAQQAAEAAAKRRIGMGFFRFAEAAAMLGFDPGSGGCVAFARDTARTLRDAACRASIALASERGPFPLFDAQAYLRPGTSASTLPPALQEELRTHGIRNSHLLCVATDHLAVAAAVAPFVDAAVAHTIVVSREMPFQAFEQLVVEAWREGVGACAISFQDRT